MAMLEDIGTFVYRVFRYLFLEFMTIMLKTFGIASFWTGFIMMMATLPYLWEAAPGSLPEIWNWIAAWDLLGQEMLSAVVVLSALFIVLPFFIIWLAKVDAFLIGPRQSYLDEVELAWYPILGYKFYNIIWRLPLILAGCMGLGLIYLAVAQIYAVPEIFGHDLRFLGVAQVGLPMVRSTIAVMVGYTILYFTAAASETMNPRVLELLK